VEPSDRGTRAGALGRHGRGPQGSAQSSGGPKPPCHPKGFVAPAPPGGPPAKGAGAGGGGWTWGELRYTPYHSPSWSGGVALARGRATLPDFFCFRAPGGGGPPRRDPSPPARGGTRPPRPRKLERGEWQCGSSATTPGGPLLPAGAPLPRGGRGGPGQGGRPPGGNPRGLGRQGGRGGLGFPFPQGTIRRVGSSRPRRGEGTRGEGGFKFPSPLKKKKTLPGFGHSSAGPMGRGPPASPKGTPARSSGLGDKAWKTGGRPPPGAGERAERTGAHTKALGQKGRAQGTGPKARVVGAPPGAGGLPGRCTHRHKKNPEGPGGRGPRAPGKGGGPRGDPAQKAGARAENSGFDGGLAPRGSGRSNPSPGLAGGGGGGGGGERGC